jgi:hypothetical protein
MGALGHNSKMQRPTRPSHGQEAPGGQAPEEGPSGCSVGRTRFQFWCAFALCGGVMLSCPGARAAPPADNGSDNFWAERTLRRLLSDPREVPRSPLDVRRVSARPSEISRRALLELAADSERTGDALVRVELARALRAHQTSYIDNSLTLALLTLLDHPTKRDAPGIDRLAVDTAAMALLRSPDPLARRALLARARGLEPSPARTAARRALGEEAPSANKKKSEPPSPPLTKKQLAGPLAALLPLFQDDSTATRLAVSQALMTRLRSTSSPKERIWIAGAAAERYRAEWSTEVRKALIALLVQAGRTPASRSTLALAADLDPDALLRKRAAEALSSQFQDQG